MAFALARFLTPVTAEYTAVGITVTSAVCAYEAASNGGEDWVPQMILFSLWSAPFGALVGPYIIPVYVAMKFGQLKRYNRELKVSEDLD